MGKKKSHSKKIFKKRKTIGQKLINSLRTFDVFGKSIVLTYKGDDKYRTHVGGLFSILMSLIVFTYILYLFKLMITLDNTSFVKTTFMTDLYKENEVIYPGLENGRNSQFDFALRLTSRGTEYLNDPTVFNFTLDLVKQERRSEGDSNSIVRTKTPFEFTQWGTDTLNYEHTEEITRLEIDRYYCPTEHNYSIAGSFFSPEFHFLDIKVKRWTGDNWRNAEELEEIYKNARLSLVMVNTVINLQDYENPISYTLDDGYFWDLEPGIRKKTDIFIRKNEASYEDGFIQLGFPEEEEFFQVIESKDRTEAEPADGTLLSVIFRYDKISDSYERQIFSLGEVLGQSGGFYASLFALSSLIFTVFSEKLFVGSVLRKIYQIDTWQEREKLDKTKQKAHLKHYKNRKIKLRADGRGKKYPYTKSEKFHANTFDDIKKFSNLKEAQISNRSATNLVADPENEDFKGEMLEKCEKSMRERRVFKYGYLDILHAQFCCLPCRRKRKMGVSPRFRDHLYFEIGEEKLLEELDCVTIIKAVRQLKLLTAVMLNRKQKFLMKFQRNNVIDSSSSGTSDEGRVNIVDLMSSKNAKHAQIVNEKIKKVIDSFSKQEITDIDRRIFSGIVKKRFSDSEWDEDEEVNTSRINSVISNGEGKHLMMV